MPDPGPGPEEPTRPDGYCDALIWAGGNPANPLGGLGVSIPLVPPGPTDEGPVSATATPSLTVASFVVGPAAGGNVDRLCIRYRVERTPESWHIGRLGVVAEIKDIPTNDVVDLLATTGVISVNEAPVGATPITLGPSTSGFEVFVGAGAPPGIYDITLCISFPSRPAADTAMTLTAEARNDGDAVVIPWWGWQCDYVAPTDPPVEPVRPILCDGVLSRVEDNPDTGPTWPPTDPSVILTPPGPTSVGPVTVEHGVASMVVIAEPLTTPSKLCMRVRQYVPDGYTTGLGPEWLLLYLTVHDLNNFLEPILTGGALTVVEAPPGAPNINYEPTASEGVTIWVPHGDGPFVEGWYDFVLCVDFPARADVVAVFQVAGDDALPPEYQVLWWGWECADGPDPEPGIGCDGALQQLYQNEFASTFVPVPNAVTSPATPTATGPVSVEPFAVVGYETETGTMVVDGPASDAVEGFEVRFVLEIPSGYDSGAFPFRMVLADGLAPAPVTLTAGSITVNSAPVGPLLLSTLVNTGLDPDAPPNALFIGTYGPDVAPGVYDISVRVSVASRSASSMWAYMHTGAFIINIEDPVAYDVTYVSWSWRCSSSNPPLPLSADCLGTGSYQLGITQRATRYSGRGELVDQAQFSVLGCDWARARDTTTAATVTVRALPGCVPLLANLDTSVAEITLWRDEDPVWSGPVDKISDNEIGQIVISAFDISNYFTERVVVPASYIGMDAAQVAFQMLQAALVLDDPGEITLEWHPCGVNIDKVIAADDTSYVMDQVNELAQSLIDWVVVDRTIIIGGRNVAENPPLDITLVNTHFIAPPSVSLSREGMATEVIMKGSTGIVGRAGGPRADDGVLITRVFEDSSIVTVPDAEQAARNILAIVSEPIAAVEGDSTALRPQAPIDAQTLIPGIEVPVQVGNVVVYDGVLALASVDASFDGTTESISITLEPGPDGGLMP